VGLVVPGRREAACGHGLKDQIIDLDRQEYRHFLLIWLGNAHRRAGQKTRSRAAPIYDVTERPVFDLDQCRSVTSLIWC
jgi:hypothetical protein